MYNNNRSSKKLWMVLFGVVLCFVVSFILLNNNTFATTSDEVVETNLLGNYVDDGDGCGVYKILNLVIDILSMGVVVAGVIGVTLVGIQYMSAKDNEEKTRKAKNRMLEIVIGLVAYAMLFVGAQWLLPGGMINQKCKTITSEQLTQMKQEEKKKEQEKKEKEKNKKQEKKAKEQAKKEKQEEQKKSKAYEKCMKNAAKVIRNEICELDKPAERLNATALALAWPAGNKEKSKKSATTAFTKAMKETKTNDGESNKCRIVGKACGMFVGTVVRAAGIDKNFPKAAVMIYPYVKKSSKWKEVSTSSPQAGDISLSYFSNGKAGHVSIYVKNKKGKIVTAQGSLCDFWGRVENKKSYTGSGNKTFRYVGG